MKRATISYAYGPLGAKLGEAQVDGEVVRVREDGSYTVVEGGPPSKLEGREDVIGEVESSYYLRTALVVSVEIGEATEERSA